MGLDGSQRATGLGGDLVKAQLAEEAQGDHLTIRFIELAHGRPDAGGAFRPQ